MVYNILINQKELSKFKGLDFDDAAILQLVKDMLVSQTSIKMNYHEKVYVWVSFKFVQGQLPMLKSNGRTSVYKRIQKLVDCGILERHPDNITLGKTFVCAGKMFDRITGITSKSTRSTIEHPVQNPEHTRSGMRTHPVQNPERNNTHNNKVKGEFESFKKEYPHTRCSFDKATLILKKNKIKIEDVIHLLLPAIQKENEVREYYKSKDEFFPSPAMMTTWLNDSRWEQEFAESATTRKSSIIKM